MPIWITIILGVVAGLPTIAAALVFAFAPYLRARPPRAAWPSGAAARDWGGYPGESGAFSGGEGGGSCGPGAGLSC